ncbi:hypothetical protein PN462_03680 [Spirulina sp. CS-785/01]|uniref:hypothetical protein n=1 Tax=Spirulina sp. CS-785/01 TaxID=3021716 RepID=UPI00232E6371|nr:hypothetical protein [Spirulina sp. CS-785/01]MDB9312191.1 hypothetical protein [Spirulina sp. CS-785/01]
MSLSYKGVLLTLLLSGWMNPAIAQRLPEQIAQLSPPIFESIRISPLGFNQQTLRGISGGETSAREISDRGETATGPCVGFVDREPDHVVTLISFFDFLSLQVQSPEDTTLLIQGPGGTWCNDDYLNQNPGIAGQWLAGSYRIWVGSYEKNTYHPYIIRLTQNQE